MVTTALVVTIALAVAAAAGAGAWGGAAARRIGVVAAAIIALLSAWCVWAVYPGVHLASLGTLPWLPEGSGTAVFGVFLDPLSSLLLLVVTVIGFLSVLYSSRYLRESNREHPVAAAAQRRYYFWLLLFVASMVGVAVSPNFLQLLIFWELTTVCSWALISFRQDAASLRSGFKALVMTHVGGAFFLGAVLVLFATTGSFEFTALAGLPDRLRPWVFAMLMLAAWAKAAQVPFHTWLPDAMAAPTPVSAYLHAAAMVKAGVYLMARSLISGWAMPPQIGVVLGAMALLTMFVALSYYFVQDDLKRLLAYSTIAHLGYVLLGVALGALGSTVGLRGGVLHIICHGFAKATLFLCAGAVAYITGTRRISDLGGVARVMPLTATAFFVGVLAVTGVPPLACFWSKFMLLAGAIQLGGVIGPVLLVLVLVESLVSFGWLVHIGQKVFFGAPTPAACVNSDPPPAMSIALVLLIVGCLVAPAIGIPLVQLIGR
jgi:hydrogenase-4 component D